MGRSLTILYFGNLLQLVELIEKERYKVLTFFNVKNRYVCIFRL